MNNQPTVNVISTIIPRWISDFNAVSDELAESGCRVEMYHPKSANSHKEGWQSKQTEERCRKKLHPGVSSQTLPYSGYDMGVVEILKSAFLGFRLATKRKELTILWTILPILLFGPPLRLFGRPVIYQITGLGSVFAVPAEQSRRRRITERVYQYLFTGNKFRIMVHNHEDKDFLCKRFQIEPYKIHVTGGCGVDPASFPFQKNLANNTLPVIYSPIRLSVEKGVYDVCKASRILNERGIQHEIWFTSDIDPNQDTSLTKSDVEDIKVNYPSIRFLGFQKSIVDTLKKADLICIPTWYREGLPTAILEAAASGRTLITTDNVGGREFVRDGIEGLLVNPKDPEALAVAIEKLINNPELAETMRQAAFRRFLSGYTKRHMVDITVKACKEVWPHIPSAAGD